MTENKKVIGATECKWEDIKFKSKWECRVYQILKEAGLNPEYENLKICLQETFKPTVSFYTKVKNKKSSTTEFKVDNYQVRAVTYTPDFKVLYNNTTYFIEAKGIKTDSYSIKVKLFRKYLENNYPNAIVFEVYTQKDLKNAIKIIKNEEFKRDITSN